MSDPFIAEIRIFAGNFAPRGWAFCNGQLLPIAQNTAVFSIVGTTYGGDGRTTLGLPRLQGRVPMHPGNGPGLTSRRLGELDGDDTTQLTQSNIPQHSHTFQGVSNAGNTASPAGARLAAAPMYEAGEGSHVDLAGSAVGTAGSIAQAHNNMQPYLDLNFIFALVGTFPTRA